MFKKCNIFVKDVGKNYLLFQMKSALTFDLPYHGTIEYVF